jgi:MFS family permease
MGTVLSLLLMLAVMGLLIALSPAHARRIKDAAGRPRRRTRRYAYTPMGYAFSATFAAALFLVSGLIGYRLNKERLFADTRWANDVIWWQVWVGVAAACIAVYLWRTGLRDIRSNVYTPELAGRDAAAPPSRRIERR